MAIKTHTHTHQKNGFQMLHKFVCYMCIVCATYTAQHSTAGTAQFRTKQTDRRYNDECMNFLKWLIHHRRVLSFSYNMLSKCKTNSTATARVWPVSRLSQYIFVTIFCCCCCNLVGLYAASLNTHDNNTYFFRFCCYCCCCLVLI